MTSITKLLLGLAILLSPIDASINLPQHAASSAALNRRQMGRFSSSMPRMSTTNCRGRTTAFIDPKTIMSTVGSFYRTQPYRAAFVTSAIKGVAADVVAQKAESKPSQEEVMRGGASTPRFDVKRNLAFLLYAGIYQGMGLELIYNVLLPQLCGSSNFLKVLVSMLVVSPFLTLPMAYVFKALVFQKSMTTALGEYSRDVRQGLLKTYWKIWIPFQTLAFVVVPTHFRIAFIAAISFAWMILFSSISSK